MFLVSLILFSSFFTFLFLLKTDLLTNWYDFWIIIVTFLVFLIIGGILIVVFLLLSTLFIKDKTNENKLSKFCQKIILFGCEFFIQVGRVKVNVRGLDKIPTDKPFLLVLNHQSNYDSIVALWSLRFFPLTFIMKKSLLNIIVAGKHFSAAGFLGLDRSNAREGIKTINKAAEMINCCKYSICVFPEGTRSKKLEMIPFHHGSFKVAYKATCPIVVGAIQNTSLVRSRYPFKSTKVYFDIIDVFEYDSFKDLSTNEISDQVHKMIEDDLLELKKYKV